MIVIISSSIISIAPLETSLLLHKLFFATPRDLILTTQPFFATLRDLIQNLTTQTFSKFLET